jgi:putative tricarboxylic transport membrane protein
MGNAKKREFALGLVMLCAGLLYLLLTFNLPRKGFIDAAFVPYVLGFAMCVLGTAQLAAAKHMAMATADAGGTAGDTKAERRIDYATVLRTVGLIIGYVALIDYVGFPIMTARYLYAQFLVLTPSGDKTPHLLYGAIAIVAAAAIHVTFRFGFDLMLPTGLLD